jgi:dCMP deaminase
MKVGAIIVKDDRIISHGYNGSAPGAVNCCDHFKDPIYGPDGKLIPELREVHHKWSREHEIHAEANAITWAARRGLSTEGADMYVTLSPCEDCCKLIKAAGIKTVYFLDEYDKGSTNWISNLCDGQVGVKQIIDKVKP